MTPQPHHAGENESLIRSYAESNRALATAFSDYCCVRGFSPQTIRSYAEIVQRFIDQMGSASVADADRSVIRTYLGTLLSRGLSPKSVDKQTFALRSFFKFVQLSGLTRHNPTLMLSQRKIPGRIPRVLTVAEIERLIAAAQNPVEAAVVEFLYATGVRVSELVATRLENIEFPQGDVTLGVAHVKKGKGGKDRTVLFGRSAAAALRKMIESRPPQAGFLFEAPARCGCICKEHMHWSGFYYDGERVQRYVRIGTCSDLPTRADARRAFERILAVSPGYRPKPPRPYTDRAIRLMVSHMGIRAGIGRVYPHALRRACATHLLEGGADLRVIQDLLGHERVTTTALYTSLSPKNLKEIHTRCHPTAEGNENEKK
jgi:site-specific recombinase XerD